MNTALLCPRCEQAATPGHECERIHHGRRFFLLGALAMPMVPRLDWRKPQAERSRVLLIQGPSYRGPVRKHYCSSVASAAAVAVAGSTIFVRPGHSELIEGSITLPHDTLVICPYAPLSRPRPHAGGQS